MEGYGGVCPTCGSDSIEYDVPTKESDGTLILPFTCDDCGAIGQETFKIELIGVEAMNSDEIDIDDEDSDDTFLDDEDELDDDQLDDELSSLEED